MKTNLIFFVLLLGAAGVIATENSTSKPIISSAYLKDGIWKVTYVNGTKDNCTSCAIQNRKPVCTECTSSTDP